MLTPAVPIASPIRESSPGRSSVPTTKAFIGTPFLRPGAPIDD
jgi:hypothetical protein